MNSLVYNFNLISKKLQTLAQQGLYVVVNLFQSGGQNFAEVLLVDDNSNTHARQKSQPLPSGVGFVYANVGFNRSAFGVALQANQTYAGFIKIANQQSIYYKQNPDLSAASTAPIDNANQFIPVATGPYGDGGGNL